MSDRFGPLWVLNSANDSFVATLETEPTAEVAVMVEAAVDEAAHYWSPRREVRFVADVCVIDRWSEAK